jgi:low affinity Fe/Cu permease
VELAARSLSFPKMIVRPLRNALTSLGVLTSRPIALYIIAAYCVLWLIFDRQSLQWNGVATIATLLMTVIIQRAERRDTQAIHAKLDHLLISLEKSANEVSQIDQMQPEDIEKARATAHAEAGLEVGGVKRGTKPPQRPILSE